MWFLPQIRETVSIGWHHYLPYLTLMFESLYMLQEVVYPLDSRLWARDTILKSEWNTLPLGKDLKGVIMGVIELKKAHFSSSIVASGSGWNDMMSVSFFPSPRFLCLYGWAEAYRTSCKIYWLTCPVLVWTTWKREEPILCNLGKGETMLTVGQTRKPCCRIGQNSWGAFLDILLNYRLWPQDWYPLRSSSTNPVW